MIHIGHGIDAHRFKRGIELMLGCIHFPYEYGLDGHSDGDVVAHALGDALLGACRLGDIGEYFPSSDPQWEGVSGAQLLRHIGDLVSESKWTIMSAHVVVIASVPKIAPLRESMVRAISSALGVGEEIIMVGATTTDGMGVIGRAEGIAASAVVLVNSPM